MKRMKKLTAALLLMMVMTVLLAGCAEGKDLLKPFREKEKPASDYVQLGQYMGVSAEKIEVEQVTEELLEMYRKQAMYTYAEYSEVTRAAQDGDKVVISYKGYMDGEAFEGGTAQSEEAVLGMDEYIPGFEEGIVGMEIGQTKQVDVVFPEDYWSADFAGKDAYFEITLEKIYGATLPAYDDALMQKMGFDTVEEYEAYIKAALEEEFAANAETAQLSAVWAVVRENCTILEYPEEEVEVYVADYTEYYTSLAAYSEQTLDEYLQTNYDMTEQEFMDTVTGWAYEEIGDILIVKAIIEAEGMELTEEEYADAKLMLMEQTGYSDEEDFVADYGYTFEEYYGADNIVLAVLQEEVYQMVVENAKLS